MRPSSLGGSWRAVVWCGALGVASLGCNDPVADARIDALGPEVDGVPEGPLHRAGQPCVLCHSDYGGADPEMSIGGSVFQTRTSSTPVANVAVTLVDSLGSSPPISIATNEAGNFWIPMETWDPAFPLQVAIECSGGTRTMNSWIGRDGSCNRCHYGPPDQGSPGWVACN
jgi:hypothetical protein